MQYTKEQESIIQTSTQLRDGETMKVNACAGSGKTSTAVGIAKAKPNDQILYIVFNKSMQLEAEKRFPKNTHVKTVHALAYNYIIKEQNPHRIIRNKEYNVKEIVDILQEHNLVTNAGSSIYTTGMSIVRDLNKFMNSGYTDIKAFLKETKGSSYTKEIWDMIVSGELDSTHSSYLKEFQLAVDQNPNILRDKYSLIILDEAQDTNPVTWAIIRKTDIAMVFVGDTHQNIYSFRDTINIMDLVKATHNYYLTGNFRSTQDILDVANDFMNKHNQGSKLFNMVSCVKYSDEELNNHQSRAKIFRTNIGIIKYLEQAMLNEPDTKIHIPRGVDQVFEYINQLTNWMHTGKTTIPSYKWLEKFKDLDDLQENYLSQLEGMDYELEQTIKVSQSLGSATLKAIYNFAKDKTNQPITKETVNLLTAHTSKGLEFDSVEIQNDFPCIDELKDKLNRKAKGVTLKDVKEAINLFYVTLTRGKKEVIDNSISMKPFRPQVKDRELDDLKKEIKTPHNSFRRKNISTMRGVS